MLPSTIFIILKGRTSLVQSKISYSLPVDNNILQQTIVWINDNLHFLWLLQGYPCMTGMWTKEEAWFLASVCAFLLWNTCVVKDVVWNPCTFQGLLKHSIRVDNDYTTLIYNKHKIESWWLEEECLTKCCVGPIRWIPQQITLYDGCSRSMPNCLLISKGNGIKSGWSSSPSSVYW